MKSNNISAENKHSLNDKNDLEFIFPINGDVVNERDGYSSVSGIVLTVKLTAKSDGEVYVNDIKAENKDGIFTVNVPVSFYGNVLVANDIKNGETAKITVFYFCDAVKKFRLSSDDNILFLKNITDHKDEYSSIFDNPYLAVYKKAHDMYGAKVHLNLFYEIDKIAASKFNPSPEYFNLAMTTDKFKDEFIKNSDWLKLAFHSKSEFPDKPYLHDSAKEITADCIAVNREIIRFAGKECISDSTTTHWGAANLECVRALRSLGYRSLTGYFEKYDDEFIVSYYMPDEMCEHIGERDFYYDLREDMIFGRIDLVLNEKSFGEMLEKLKNIVSHPHRGGFVSIMIHEQYFYTSYIDHLPDFEKRVLTACEYLYKNGYSGAHVTEVSEEKHLKDNQLFSKNI